MHCLELENNLELCLLPSDVFWSTTKYLETHFLSLMRATRIKDQSLKTHKGSYNSFHFRWNSQGHCVCILMQTFTCRMNISQEEVHSPSEHVDVNSEESWVMELHVSPSRRYITSTASMSVLTSKPVVCQELFPGKWIQDILSCQRTSCWTGSDKT